MKDEKSICRYMYLVQDNKDVFSLFTAVIQRKKGTGALEMGMSFKHCLVDIV